MMRLITFDEAALLGTLAKKDGIHLSDEFSYVGAWEDGKLVAVAGWSRKGEKAVLRSAFTHPDYRMRGIYRRLNDFRVKILLEHGVRTMEVNCRPASVPLHLHNGGKITRQFKFSTRIVYRF